MSDRQPEQDEAADAGAASGAAAHSRPSLSPARIASFLGVVAVVLSLMSGLLYWLIRVGYDSFYSSLGVRPEEVGISQAAMTSRAALVAAVFPFVLGIFLGPIAVPLLIPVRDARSWSAFATIAAVAMVSVFLPIWPNDAVVALPALIGIGLGLRAACLRGRLESEQRGNPGPWRRWKARYGYLWSPVALALLAVVSLYGLDVLYEWLDRSGQQMAENLVAGQPVDDQFVVSILGINPPAVEVVWTSEGKRPPELRALAGPLYLGQADGMAVFYDWRHQQIVRLPTGTFALCQRVMTDVSAGAADGICPVSTDSGARSGAGGPRLVLQP